MKTDEKITLWSERIRAFQSSGQTCKTWCQEHHVPVSTMSYWMCKLKTLDEQSDTDMIFAKMPTEKEISTNETLNTSLSPVRIFITNSIRIEVMPECPSELFRVLIQGLKDHALILSILVDTFISKISFPMQPGPEIGSISDA